MDWLCPNMFKRMFFVDRDTFQEIMERICPFVANQDEQKAINSSGAAIPLRTMVAMALRWLASTSYLDLCFAWGTSSSMFYHPRGTLWPTLEAIDVAFHIGSPFDDDFDLETLASGFKQHSSGILKGCVLAIDGFGVAA
jgi:hypothetical protein